MTVKKKNSKARDLAILAGVIVLASAGGFYYLSMQDAGHMHAEQDADDEADAEVIKTEEEAIRQREILEGFESALNNFLSSIDQQVGAYQQKRNIVRDMIKPENMRQFEYVVENQGIAKEIMDNMKSDMEKIILFITQSDLNIQNYLERENPGNRDELLQQWDGVKDRQSALYVSFFDMERQLLDQFDLIFTIFVKSKGNYNVDVANSNVVFADASIAREYLNAKRRIEAIILQERQLLSRAQGGESNAAQVPAEPAGQGIIDEGEQAPVAPSDAVQETELDGNAPPDGDDAEVDTNADTNTQIPEKADDPQQEQQIEMQPEKQLKTQP